MAVLPTAMVNVSPRRVDRDQPTAPMMSFTRSVFSQEKPPSRSGARMRLRLRNHVLAATEADLEAHVVDGNREEGGEVAWRRRAELDCELRQQCFHQCRLMRPQRVAFAPSEEGAALNFLVV